MAVEGDLKKANGDIWYAGDVNALLKQSSIVYKNNAQMIFNSAYLGFDSDLNIASDPGVPNLFNTTFNILTTSDGFDETLNTPFIINDTSHSVYYLAQGDLIYSGDIYDDYEGTTPDTAKWEELGSGGAILSQTDNVSINSIESSTTGTEELILSAKALDIAPNTKSETIVRVQGTFSSSATLTSMVREFIIRDDLGNEVVLDTVSTLTNSYNKTFRIVIEGTNADVYDITSNYNVSPISKDISSLVGTSFHLRLRQEGGRAGNNTVKTHTVRFYPLVFVNGSAITSTSVETTAVTHTATIAEGYVTVNGELTGLALGLSANNGSNFTVFTNDTIGVIDNSGTQFKIKFTFSGSLELIPKISEYLGSYNIW